MEYLTVVDKSVRNDDNSHSMKQDKRLGSYEDANFNARGMLLRRQNQNTYDSSPHLVKENARHSGRYAFLTYGHLDFESAATAQKDEFKGSFQGS